MNIMFKKIRNKRAISGLFLLLTAVVLGVLAVSLSTVQAVGPISEPAGVDSDTGTTAGPGVDGRDFSVSWTPGTQPAGYTDTQIFIFPTGMNPAPTRNNVLINGCTGSAACQPRGFFTQFQQNSFTLPQFTTTDSNGTTLVAGTYIACVFTNATTTSLDCSASFTAASDTVTDTNPPMIEHMSVSAAQAQTNAVINGFIIDDQTTDAQFGNTGDGEQEYFKLAYGANLVSAETRIDAVSVSGKLFQFTVPSAAVPAAGGNFQYYITAKDRAGNERFFCANPSATTAVACKAAPFIVNTVAAGSRTVAGTISANSMTGAPSALGSAKVFPAGFAHVAVTTGGDGTYTIGSGEDIKLPNNFPFDFTAYKTGYTKNMRMEMIGGSNLAGVDINLNTGDMGFFTGGGGMFAGDMSPHVIFSGPPDNAQNVPLTENIRVGISQPLNAQTVNDGDASNVGSSVYLTTDGTTKLGGTVTWCSGPSAPGCSALMTMDTNTILFNPFGVTATNLTANTFYTLVITEAVTSESGQSIAGNRSGGGHRISFTTSAGTTFSGADLATEFGNGGQYLPPYVKSTLPAPGNTVAPNVRPLVEFNETMNLGTLTLTNVKLVKLPSTAVTSTVSVDSNETRFVTLTPQTTPANTLTAGDYEIQVLGAVANARGMTMQSTPSSIAFRTTFTVSGSADTSPPTIYPLVASGGTISVNEGTIQFGFSEPLAASTVTSSNITIRRGSTAVTADVVYNASENSVYIIPGAALVPNTSYTVTIGTSVTDLAGVALASAATYTYTTGAADTVAPRLREARCDDYTCTMFFTEPMNHETPGDTNYANSVLKQANWIIERTAPSASVIDVSGKPTTYDGENYSVTIQGVAGLAYGDTFRVTANAVIQDLAKNGINTTSSANIIVGAVENSQATFGSFGDTGMFGPPVAGVGSMGPPVGGTAGASVALGGQFTPQGFGTFTAEQFGMGQADMAYPFNPMAGQSSNVFQVRFSPGAALVDGDLVELTFPRGTGISGAVQDTFSPFENDFNSMGAGTVTFGAADTDGISVDTAAMTVTVQLAITGTPVSTDTYTIDLKGITNPSVPKGPESGGYTVDIKVKRGTPAQIVVNKTSTPYYIMEGGSRSITVKIYAGTAVTGTAGANGNVHLWGGGPGGPMDKLVTLTNGITTAADGTAIAADAGIVYSSLPDGCYNFGTEPYVALGGVDYYGQMSPEPVCVNATTPDVTKNIVLASASGAGTVNVTVKMVGSDGVTPFNFGDNDVDIFAGGPGRYVVKTLTGLNAADVGGYTLTLNSNGHWNIGVGPSMSKGTSMSMPKALPGMPPPPTDVIVSGLPGSGAIAAGFMTPPGVAVAGSTITFTFATANKTVSGTINDGTTGLSNVNVFMHALGFGQPAFTMTKSDGTFTLNVADLGSYEIGVSKDGLPPVMKNIELRPNNVATVDGNATADVYYKGKVITTASPLVISLKKGAYTISGKVLDSSNNGIGYAPIFAIDANGNVANSGTSSDGSYTIFVDAGVWTVKSMMPPDKTDACGTFEKIVTVTTESKSSQNITPSTGTCYTLSGTVTVTGVSTLNNVPVSVDEWDATNSRPIMGGMFRGTSTNSSGVYSIKVAGAASPGKTYRISTWDPTYGELSTTAAVVAADVTNAHITSGTTGTVTFAFTNGTTSHEAFIELKKANDNFTRISKPVKGLASNATFTVKEGTYNYFVNVFGVGDYTGTVATGATATIDLTQHGLIVLSGNVKDNASTPVNVSGALITAKSSDGTVKTATTDSSGNYSLSVKAGTYTVSASKAEHIAGQTAESVTLATTTANYDFGGTSTDPTTDQAALKKSDQVISGTIYQSNGSTAATNASVTATESTTGVTVTAPVDSVTGAYTLPVDDGTWTVKAVAPSHAKTTKSGTVTVTGTTDSTGSTNNITLTADATKISTSTSASLSSASGGSINDTDNTGLKFTAGQGVLETGSATISVDVEKTFTAPDTDTFTPLASAAFSIEAQNAESTSQITDLKGNAEIQIDYTSLLSSLPGAVSEANLKLVYYSTEKDAYVPVEGGFTVDATNNTITGQVAHLTDFAIVYSPPVIIATGGPSDLIPPAAATNVRATATSSAVTLTWTNPSDGDFYRTKILRNSGGTTPVSGNEISIADRDTVRYADSTVSSGITYIYQLKSCDTSNNCTLGSEVSIAMPTLVGPGPIVVTPAPSVTPAVPATPATPATPGVTPATPAVPATTAVSARAAQLAKIQADAPKIVSGFETLASSVGVARSSQTEAKALTLVNKIADGLAAAIKETVQAYVAYGTGDNLGAGERAGVVNSYKSAFGAVPQVASDWEDVLKIANGRWPSKTSETAETAAKTTFKKIYLREAAMTNANDNAAVTIMSYGLRSDIRRLDAEKAAIKNFKGIFKKAPLSATDWDAVRAIGYSGATR